MREPTSNPVLQAFADAREEAETLRRFGQGAAADAVQALLDRLGLVGPLRELMTDHDEKGATLLSGKPAGHFRARFEGWKERGLARSGKRGQRFYSEVVIPRKPALEAIRQDAERTAERDRLAS